MSRLTKDLKGNFYITDETKIKQDETGFSGEAINKLAVFENIYDDIHKQQSELHNELEILRNEGKTKSLKFKELMTKKLINTSVIILFESYKLKK